MATRSNEDPTQPKRNKLKKKKKEWEYFGKAGKINYDNLEKRRAVTKGKKSGKYIHEKPR